MLTALFWTGLFIVAGFGGLLIFNSRPTWKYDVAWTFGLCVGLAVMILAALLHLGRI